MTTQVSPIASQQLDPLLLEVICCPACRGDLTYDMGAQELHCSPCAFTYPIIEGIPVLFPTNVKARFQELFHRFWDSEERAAVYDRFVEGAQSMMDMHTHLGEVQTTMEVLGPLSNQRILDCGCGNGRFFEQYPRGVVAFGIDASLNLLRICKQKGRCTRLVCGELEHLPFKTGAFDRALSVRVIQHLRQQADAVAEMARVLRPSGEMIMHCYNGVSSKGVVKRIRQTRLAPILNAPFRAIFRSMSPFEPWGIPYDQYNSAWQVKRWLRASGTSVKMVRGASFGFNKWFLSGFMIIPWVERKNPALVKRYLNWSLRTELVLGRLWPFSHLMEKFVIKSRKVV
ncbi:MAG: methyltransferase domain-containing protein [Longimicrobiales bacterium]